jgi:hypothetical protein
MPQGGRDDDSRIEEEGEAGGAARGTFAEYLEHGVVVIRNVLSEEEQRRVVEKCACDACRRWNEPAADDS